MLKVTLLNDEQTVTMKLEGRLAGPWVQEVTRVWVDTAGVHTNRFVVDLQSVTFIDNSGRALLSTMFRRGAQIIAKDCLTRTIVDEIEQASRKGMNRGANQGT